MTFSNRVVLLLVGVVAAVSVTAQPMDTTVYHSVRSRQVNGQDTDHRVLVTTSPYTCSPDCASDDQYCDENQQCVNKKVYKEFCSDDYECESKVCRDKLGLCGCSYGNTLATNDMFDDCVDGYFCAAPGAHVNKRNSCVPQRPIGIRCSKDFQCLSESCNTNTNLCQCDPDDWSTCTNGGGCFCDDNGENCSCRKLFPGEECDFDSQCIYGECNSYGTCSCFNQNQCGFVEDTWCNTNKNKCVPKRATGTTCNENYKCLSGNCDPITDKCGVQLYDECDEDSHCFSGLCRFMWPFRPSEPVGDLCGCTNDSDCQEYKDWECENSNTGCDDEPKVCHINNVCYSSELKAIGQNCDSDDDCATGACYGNPGVPQKKCVCYSSNDCQVGYHCDNRVCRTDAH